MIHYVGGRAVPIQSAGRRDFSLDVNELASLINDRTKLIILNSPQNPTGGVLEQQDIEEIAEAIGDRNMMVLSDEIYSRLLFEGEHILDHVGTRNQGTNHPAGRFLKDLCDDWMANGLRRDARDLAAHMTRLMTNSNSCTASFTQVAGIEALRGDQSSVDHMRDEFQRRRDVFVAV